MSKGTRYPHGWESLRSAHLLRQVIALWPSLPEHKRRELAHRVAMAALVRSANRDWSIADESVAVPIVIGRQRRLPGL